MAKNMESAKRIIFLDIDGPVIPPRNLIARNILRRAAYGEGTAPPLNGLAKEFCEAIKKYDMPADPVAVLLISDLAFKTGAKIVISSSWRVHGYDNFITDFQDFGFDLSLLHDDWRSSEHVLSCREDEITAWLSRHPEVESFVTIDDEALDFDTHIQVCAVNGFLLDNYDQAYEFLIGEERPATINLYKQAVVDYLGPRHYLEQDGRLKRCAQRLVDRAAIIRKRYER